MTNEVLKNIPPDRIDRNPDNPRLIFRSEEMATLMASISKFGIQVPLTVYQNNDKYTLIDGERRWRCATKLNLRTVPAVVKDKPSQLENLLLMFNIHALREQWDYLTIANKLSVVIELYEKANGYRPNEPQLSEETGLTRGQIRRCQLIIELPKEYKELLIEELESPKKQQNLSEDFFIEMERALKTVQTRIPEAVQDPDEARSTLIEKYRAGSIKNVTDFRKLRKIATSIDSLGTDREETVHSIRRVLDSADPVGITTVFQEGFELDYNEHKALKHGQALIKFLNQQLNVASQRRDLDTDLAEMLISLADLIYLTYGRQDR